MTKQEFLKRFRDENLTVGAEYMMILNKVSDAPLVLGCAYYVADEWYEEIKSNHV